MKQTETPRPEKFSDLADAHRQNSSRESGAGDHHGCVCDAYWAHISLRVSLANRGALPGICRLLLNKSGVLALERLGGTGAPSLSDGLGIGIGKDVVFSFLQSIEDASRR